MGNLASILGKISFYMIIIVIFLCVNYFAKLLPFIHLSSFILFLPLFLCPFCMILSIISLRRVKNSYALLGLIINSIVLLAEIIFIIIGARLLR